MQAAKRPRPSRGSKPAMLDAQVVRPFDKLPVELRREIFILATRFPTSPFEFSQLTSGRYDAFLRRIAVDHGVKLAICLVSRDWYAIARDLFYEYLFVRDSMDWSSFADALGLSHSTGPTTGRGGGRCVRRLELSTASWTPERSAAAARIIRYCPNIQLLSIGSSGSGILEVPLEIIETVFETLSHTLQGLEFTADLGPVETHRLFELLPKLTHLKAFQIGGVQPYECEVELPEMHTLDVGTELQADISGLLSVMSHWHLPSLEQVLLVCRTRMQSAVPFFEAHGSRIKSLEIGTWEAYPFGPGDDFDRILKLCTSLTELVLEITDGTVEQILRGQKTVKRLALRGLYNVEINYTCRCNVVEALKAIFPSVLDEKKFPSFEVLRLIDYDQTRFSEQRWRSTDVSFWASWVERFKSSGVGIEDHEGNALAMKFSEARVLLPEEIPLQLDGN